MAATGSSLFLAAPSLTSAPGISGRNRCLSLYRRMAVSLEQKSLPTTFTTSLTDNGRLLEEEKRKMKKKRRKDENELISNIYSNPEEITEENGKTLKDYLDECKDLLMRADAGPPRWLTPLDCGSHACDSPLLLFLPGSFFIFNNN